jgi:hypothetical protein
MNLYEYMAVGRKLSKQDNQSNQIAGLIVTTIVIGGCWYITYRLANERAKKISWLNHSMDQLKDQKNQLVEANSRLTQENALQKQKIHNLERENQSLARQLKEKQKQEPEA